MELHRGFLNNKDGTCRGERGRRQEVSGMDKGKSALQWEAKTEELGFIHKFCLMKLHPSCLLYTSDAADEDISV